jgi:iron uptake system EfeUOB component EfeO/EfeM
MTGQTSLAPRRAIRLGYGVVALLAIGVGALGVLDWRAHQARRGAPEDAAVTITVTGRGCEPDSLTVPAGRSVFRIVNRGERALEWEILDGVMVLEERENIAPGLSQRLVARLAPGEYAITCGLLGNPRGRLRVVPPAAGAAPAAPDLRALVGPMAEYKVYLTLRGAALAEAADALGQAMAAGGDAGAALAAAHAAYQHLRPASRLSQVALDTALEASADDDSNPTGFQPLALALRRGDVGAAAALATRLRADITALLAGLDDAMVPPDSMLAGAALMAREAARISDPALAAAMLGGVAEVVRLLGPPARAWDMADADQMIAGLAAARKAMAADPAAGHTALRGLAETIDALRLTLARG